MSRGFPGNRMNHYDRHFSRFHAEYLFVISFQYLRGNIVSSDALIVLCLLENEELTLISKTNKTTNIVINDTIMHSCATNTGVITVPVITEYVVRGIARAQRWAVHDHDVSLLAVLVHVGAFIVNH
jgi:hypothetical protein